MTDAPMPGSHILPGRPMHKLLLIDDEPVIQHAFRKAFHPPEYETRTARSLADGLRLLGEQNPDVVVLDVHLPDAENLEAYDRLRAANARVPVILITGHGTADLAIEAMQRGAFDYLLKPVLYEQLRDAIARACAGGLLMTTPAVVGAPPKPGDGADALVGNSPGMQDVYKAIGRVAGTDATVLITGESGTGKELVARAIYQHSKRKDRPFLAINCGAIPENLIESELFGHERGAFTGAERKRIGKFEQCHGGTLFLDEVGETPLAAQVKLLRVLQEQAFERVGGDETVRTDVRVIAATNRDLAGAVDAGHFRADLYYRLNVVHMEMPPLRSRGGDILVLANAFLRRFAADNLKPVEDFDQDARTKLLASRWPGNVRELENAIERAVVLCEGTQIEADDLPTDERSAASNQVMVPGATLAEIERWAILATLEATNGSTAKAAEMLDVSVRTIQYRLHEYAKPVS